MTRKRTAWKFVAGGTMAVVLAVTAVLLLTRQPTPVVPPTPATVLEYGRPQEKVIDLGSVPTAMTAFFSEALQRDRVFNDELVALGWTLRVHVYKSGFEAAPYADGRLEVLLVGDLPALYVAAKGQIGIFAVIREGYNTLISTRRLTPGELKGLKVGYPLLTTSHFALDQVLAAGRLTLADVTSVPLQAEDAANALRRGLVDAVEASEPQATAILEAVAGARTVARSETYNLAGLDLTFVKDYPRVARLVLAALLRATNWARQDSDHVRQGLAWVREGAVDFVGRSSLEDSPTWVSLFERETIDNPSFPFLPQVFREPFGRGQRLFEFLVRYGYVDRSLNYSTVAAKIDTDLLPELVRQGSLWRLHSFDYSRSP